MSVRIVNIVGTRPNMMKIAPIMEEMSKDDLFQPVLVHTGQHYDCLLYTSPSPRD